MKLRELMEKFSKRVIGLMGGTSADGVDAVLVRIDGHGMDTRVRQEAYVSLPFEPQVRRRILEIAGGAPVDAQELCRMNGLLGILYLEACQKLCQKAGAALTEIDLVGSHGQTVWHQPKKEFYLGREVASTLQIGDPSILCEKLNTVVVSDFRMRDMAAGGQGAPLVPYTEYLLYRSDREDVALQNIGGIGNITFLPRDCRLSEVTAFDTGPGNMLMDAVIFRMTQGRELYDKGGRMAAAFQASAPLLAWLMEEPYLKEKPPKTTGRERYSEAFIEEIYRRAEKLGLSQGEILATVTAYTAETIAWSARTYLPRVPQRLIVGGGGSYNQTLLRRLKRLLTETEVVTNEEMGFDGDAKEAVAFAILANEAVHGDCSSAPGATGAKHPTVLGKISQ